MHTGRSVIPSPPGKGRTTSPDAGWGSETCAAFSIALLGLNFIAASAGAAHMRAAHKIRMSLDMTAKNLRRLKTEQFSTRTDTAYEGKNKCARIKHRCVDGRNTAYRLPMLEIRCAYDIKNDSRTAIEQK